MKRHITELEQKLIDSGWKLLYKTYKGKNSQFVWCYVYGKAYGNRCFKLALDQKRKTTKGIYIENVPTDYLDIAQLKEINELFLSVSNEIHELEFGFPLDDEETIEVVESVENE